MTSALDLIGFTARVDHYPLAEDAPTKRFYVGMLQDGIEVVGRRKSIILIVGRNDVVLTWRKASACRPTHAALYERPAGGEPFDGNIGPAVAEVIDQHWIRDGDMVTLTWKITWTG